MQISFQNKFLRFLYVILFSLLLSSCTQDYQEIEFRDIQGITVESITDGKAILTGVAIFHNPNNKQVKLTKADIDVFLNGEKTAKLKPDGKIKVLRKQDFQIPVRAEVALGSKGMISGIMSLLTKRPQEIQFKGSIVVKSWLIPVRIPIDHTEKMRF